VVEAGGPDVKHKNIQLLMVTFKRRENMKRITVLMVSSIMVTCILLFACSKNDSSTGTSATGSYKLATITHWGFDFSTGKSDTTNYGENNDGETIHWIPISIDNYWTDQGIWYRTRVYPNRTQSLGKVNIASITSIDTTTAAWDTQPTALSKDDVIVAQCNDGFVKFQVTADVDTSYANYGWPIDVKYLYSPVPSFDE
jgi:hypothetical protein